MNGSDNYKDQLRELSERLADDDARMLAQFLQFILSKSESSIRERVDEFHRTFAGAGREGAEREAAGAAFWAPDADVLNTEGLHVPTRGGREAGIELTRLRRPSSDEATVKIRPLGDIAIVDSNSEREGANTWVTDVWKRSGSNWLITASRVHAGDTGSAEAAFERLSAARPVVRAEDISRDLAQREEEALRSNFKTFRAAWNRTDSPTMNRFLSGSMDAIATFSFLRGRSQVLEGNMAVSEKLARMKGSSIVEGEAKSIRFLSPTMAVVDGTARITGIPRAHGIAETSMTGVYTDVWVKNGGEWAIQASRPWF
jgi:hypothetical protein